MLRKSVRFGTFEEKPRIKLSEGLCGAAVRSKEPVLVGDVTKDARYVDLIPDTRSELVVPLISKDRAIGVFDLQSPALDRFTEEHVKVLTPLASQVAVAIENARLVAELVKKEERLDRELKIAQGVQHGLLPEDNPRGPGWEASAHFLPARELGGDLYDFYELEGRRLGLAVGDVAGKGVPAALYAAFASGTVRARAFEKRTPAALMTRVNRTLRRRGVEGLFCTLAYALFDFEEHTVTLANSGLPYPLHYRAEDKRCTTVEIGGLPLGAFDSAEYEERTLRPRGRRPPGFPHRWGQRGADPGPGLRSRSAHRPGGDPRRALRRGGGGPARRRRGRLPGRRQPRRRRDPGRGQGPVAMERAAQGAPVRRQRRGSPRPRGGPLSGTAQGHLPRCRPSRGGAHAAGGAEIVLVLQLPATGGPLQVVGKVVRTAPVEHGGQDIAVIFMDLTPAAETRLDYFIAVQNEGSKIPELGARSGLPRASDAEPGPCASDPRFSWAATRSRP